MKRICKDLGEEHESLDTIVSNLEGSDWNTVTPFLGWTVKDEISHLAHFDSAARLSVTDPDKYSRHIEEAYKDPENYGAAKKISARLKIPELLAWWREERTSLINALAPMDPKHRLNWYGHFMSAESFATARLMETWAHGQDIADALKIDREPTQRLRHIAHLGVSTFGWSFSNRKMEVPKKPFRVELVSPSGDVWTWGPTDAEEAARGTAEDFCLVVVQRRHVADTNLECVGPVVHQWMLIAQAFAGPPANGPKAGTFPRKRRSHWGIGSLRGQNALQE